MSAVNSQRRVRQRTEEDRSALQAKIIDRTVIAELNVVHSNIMVPPLDSIYDIIQTYHWGYLYTCAYVVLIRLVRLFYANLEVARTMTMGWYFSPLLTGISSLLIPRSSVTSSEYQSLSCLAVLIMRWCFLPLWTISESSSMHFHREKSVLPPSRSAHCLILIACWPK
jgi:hypothetical protein